MKNEEVKSEKAERAKEAWSDIWQKTKDVSKKAAKKAHEEAKKFGEQMEHKKQEQDLKKYNPLTEEKFKSEGFNIPNIIEIVDDAVRRDIPVCDGAIGWTEFHKGIEVLHLYDEFVTKCGLTFIPLWQVDNVYCVDAFDRTKFINVNYIFGKTVEEKITELEHVAYCLGAKWCSVEIVESDAQSTATNISTNVGGRSDIAFSNDRASAQKNKQSGKTITNFKGNRKPVLPALKWFAHDESIKRLIEMRCSDNNAIKSKILELKGSISTTMSQKTAIAVDCVLGKRIKGGFSAESQVNKEQSRILIFEVEF